MLDLQDSDQVTQQIIDRSISIIFFLIDAYGDGPQRAMIQALKQVKQKTGGCPLSTHDRCEAV
jgi:hypothetical protein